MNGFADSLGYSFQDTHSASASQCFPNCPCCYVQSMSLRQGHNFQGRPSEQGGQVCSFSMTFSWGLFTAESRPFTGLFLELLTAFWAAAVDKNLALLGAKSDTHQPRARHRDITRGSIIALIATSRAQTPRI